MRTKAAEEIRSLPIGQSAGPHFLYKSISKLPNVTCHMRRHMLDSDIALYGYPISVITGWR